MHIISQGKTSLPIDIKKVEARYADTQGKPAKFMGDFCLKTKNGWQGDSCAAVFYSENPDRSLGHSNYFALVVMYDDDMKPKLYVTRGDSAFETDSNGVPIIGVVADDGEVVYSRYRHDYRSSTDGSVTIDGGRDYLRLIGDKSISAKMVYIVADGPDLKFVPADQYNKEETT